MEPIIHLGWITNVKTIFYNWIISAVVNNCDIYVPENQKKDQQRAPQPTYIVLMTILWDESILSPEGYPLFV